MDEEKIINERKNKIVNILKNRWLWTSVFLVIALILGIYIRTLPMQDHYPSQPGVQPGLWDYAKNDWTLGPDLDPWLFERIAKETIDLGGLQVPEIDHLRNVPLYFNNHLELQMVPYMIIFTYKISPVISMVASVFGANYPVNSVIFSAIFMPVLFFALTIIVFFLFVREVFLKDDEESKNKANIIALIATFFMIVVPVFLSRTVAGIPEKEAIGFFFMFLSFYLFIKAWKSKQLKYNILISVLAGISTALMTLSWGGNLYIYLTVSIATLIAFLLNKIGKKESIIYCIWLVVALGLTLLATERYNLIGFITSISTGPAIIMLLIILLNFIMIRIKPLDKISEKYRIPKNIIIIVISVAIILVAGIAMFGPGVITQRIDNAYQTMFKPIEGRWVITVAENRQPYFSEWAADFGPYIKQLPNVPIMFWMFFIGSGFLLLMTLLEKVKKKDAYILTLLYILFFIGLVFSRYAPHPNLLDGENFISKLMYLGSAVILIAGFFIYYVKYYREGNKGFEQLDFSMIFLFVLLFLSLFSARSAVRLIMVLGPIAPIFLSFLIVEIIYKFKSMKDETWKVVVGALMVFIIIAGSFTFYSYYQTVSAQAYSFVPSSYNYQWQNAMKWVRENTTEGSVFAHWWDYGYWVQSIGERPTVTDGGNAQIWWNYLTGRLVLTGDNQNDSLEFLYNHNASYLLIDSSDIGKYGAFSSIGSDKNYDRYSWIGTFLLNEKNTQETKNQTLLVYEGGIALDEDLAIEEGGREIILPQGQTGVGLIILPIEKVNGSDNYAQPYIMVQYNQVTHKIPLRYLSVNGKFIDYKTGIESAAFIFPRIDSNGQSVSQNPIGAGMWISPRLLRGYLAQKYILDDPFNKFPNFQLAHDEAAPVVQSLNSQGISPKLPDFVYFGGVQGPIKIWKIKYTGKETLDPMYIDSDYTKYIDWVL